MRCQRSKKRKDAQHRKGAAVVEFAFCLPLLVTITLSFIDLTNLIYFRQTIKIAAYDAARTASEPTSSAADVATTADRMLSMRGVENYSLDLPGDYAAINRGETVAIGLTVPLSEMTSFTGMGLWADSLTDGIEIKVYVVKE